MTQLRIVRSKKWVHTTAVPFVVGGPAHFKLVSEDRLQYEDAEGVWQDVPVIELPTPPHPLEVDGGQTNHWDARLT